MILYWCLVPLSAFVGIASFVSLVEPYFPWVDGLAGRSVGS